MREIVVAEEDEAVRTLLTHVLSAAGYLVTAVSDGATALALLSDPERQFAAAVLDHVMPGLSGPQVVTRLRPTRPVLPILVLSGGLQGPSHDPYTRFLGKPFGLPELVCRRRRPDPAMTVGWLVDPVIECGGTTAGTSPGWCEGTGHDRKGARQNTRIAKFAI